MTVTPVVSADRRYVRVSVNAFFNDLNGFSTFSFPGAAVAGGGAGNLGGAGAGINAGMNGIIGDDDYQSGVQVGTAANAAPAGGQTNGLRAGPLPGDGGAGLGDPMFFGAGMNQGNGMGMMPGFEGDEAAFMLAMENAPRRSVRAAAGDSSRSPRRSLRKSKTKPTRTESASRRKGR